MVSVQHPLHLAIAQDGKIWIAVHYLSPQDFTVEGQSCLDMPHEQIQRETTQ
jgi:hypothetical protein